MYPRAHPKTLKNNFRSRRSSHIISAATLCLPLWVLLLRGFWESLGFKGYFGAFFLYGHTIRDQNPKPKSLKHRKCLQQVVQTPLAGAFFESRTRVFDDSKTRASVGCCFNSITLIFTNFVDVLSFYHKKSRGKLLQILVKCQFSNYTKW